MKKETVSLDDFVGEILRKLRDFQRMWYKRNKENPEMYPLEIPSENSGMWDEMFYQWDGEEDE